MPFTWRAISHHGDGFDFDEPVRVGERSHRHQGGGGTLLAEEFLTHRNEVLPVTDVGEVRVDLDDRGHGAAARLDLRLDRFEHGTRLRHDIAAVGRLPLVVVGDLSREEQDGLRAGDLDALRVRGRVEDTGGAVALDRGHENLLEGRRVLGEDGDAALGPLPTTLVVPGATSQPYFWMARAGAALALAALEEMRMDEVLKERTKRTARMLFHTLKGGVGFEDWKKIDKELARELSMFFTGKLYSREVISQKQRELCAVASLTVLNREREVHAHIHAALNVGATKGEVAEVIFQQVTYGGMPVVVEALRVYKQVLEERGEWP